MEKQPFLPFDEPEPRPQKRPRADASVPRAASPAVRDAGERREATSRLIEELARVCAEHPLEEKVLIAPSLAVGHTLVERLGREGHAWVNLRVETVRTLALAAVAPELAREGLRLLSRAQALALVEQACLSVLDSESYFGELRDRPGFHRALQRTFDELRAAGISAESLPSRAFADKRKLRELRAILERYQFDVGAYRSVDQAEVLRRALERTGTSTKPPIYLRPEDLDLAASEALLVDRLSAGGVRGLPVDDPESWRDAVRDVRLQRAVGEESEIREVFRRVLAGGIRFDDVEVLYTDGATYPSLAYELSREHSVPATFASGVAASFTRPGQAALAFLEWVAGGFESDVLRRALSSGTLSFERWEAAAGTRIDPRAAGRAFRDAHIGWGASRHSRALERLVEELALPEEARRDDDEESPQRIAARAARRARRLEAARVALAFAGEAIRLSACAEGELCDRRSLARGARLFTRTFGRVSEPLDGSAMVALEKLFSELEALPEARNEPEEVAGRLVDAVRALSVDTERPRPGRVHFAEFRSGGFSGRRHTFLLGLDEARHPGADLEDPVLLDNERRSINESLAPASLALHRDRPRDTSRALHGAVARLRGEVAASYPSFDLRRLDQPGELFPSAFFLEMYRSREGNPEADYTRLLSALPPPAGFLPGTSTALDDSEWWLSRIHEAEGSAARAAVAEAVRREYPHLADGDRAEAARDSADFTEFDGWIPEGTPELDPRISGQPQAASRLERLAECPFRYFLKDVLSIEPPKTMERDTTEWLEPMAAGSLLHEVFREFFERITASGERPDASKHWGLIESIAQAQIAAWRERVPPVSASAFDQRRADVLYACRTFLALEEVHCREASPMFFEVPFGLPREARGPMGSSEPVPIPLSVGTSFPLRGSIDRVDRAADGTFQVWDYKTGGTWRHREGAGIRGGRQIQHALYAIAFETLLSRSQRGGRVSRSGYFFPGRKGEGQRMAMVLDAGRTREVLETLLDLLREGVFPHAADDDACKYCDYEAVCGGKKLATRRARAKRSAATLPALIAFHSLDD
jgi:RecB family exonuclease